MEILKFNFMKNYQSKQDEIFANTIKHIRSGIRNAFVDTATKVLGNTKNEARQLFDEINVSLNICPSLSCYEIITEKLLDFSKKLKSVNLILNKYDLKNS